MRRAYEAGQVLPLIACSLAVLMGFGGIGVDVGYLEYWQQQQQTATDAAAAGGADALLKAGCPNGNAAKSAALADASLNGFTNGANSVSITAINPPASGPFVNNICAVSVTMTTNHVATFFSKLFGYPGGMTETTQAAAVVTTTGGGCIYLLSPSVQSNFNGANVTATKCGALINDTANFNGATIDTLSIGYAGAAPNENGATFKMGVPEPMLPVADPCPEITGCAYLAANPPSLSNCQSVNDNGYTGTIQPGCYSSLNLNGANVTMASGIYVLDGSLNDNGATINGSAGVTIYVPSGVSAPNFNGANATLAPMSTGDTVGVLYYQVPSNTSPPNFNGANNKVSGLIYAPGATSANFNGAQGGYLVLVFGAANFNGGTAQDFATPPPNSSLVKQAVVAE
jgi:hypothetical protein